MKRLLATLRDYDPGMLPALAETWGIESKSLSDDEILRDLSAAMLAPDTAEAAWDKLDEAARSALQLLVSSERARMKVAQFERFYGAIRKLGRAQIQREAPHIRAASIAESLYYRGFIGEGYDQVDDKLLGFIFVPSDLAEALPLHKTSYQDLAADESAPLEETPDLEVFAEAAGATRADTSVVDDMTTLLSLLQATPLPAARLEFTEAGSASVLPLLLTNAPGRLPFLLAIGISAELIALDDGMAQPRRNEARAWLEASRSEQIRRLAQAWLGSQAYRDMWHVPGLHPEESGWSYDAAAARGAIMSMLADLLPPQGWVSINDLIEIIKEVEPDFQRPEGDYDSWYIRNADGEYLSGFESWDAVEGALIEHCLCGPMHWLGLLDTGDDALRLTAYGRAFLQLGEWPRPDEQPASIEIGGDGALRASRRVNRFERFQLARFARSAQTGDPFIYQIDADGIARAAEQGITTRHIESFLARHLGGRPLPAPLQQLLRNWQAGAKASVSLETLLVLRVTSEATLDAIYAAPDTRRYLEARLGPLACAVRVQQWQALKSRLGEEGIEVDVTRVVSQEG